MIFVLIYTQIVYNRNIKIINQKGDLIFMELKTREIKSDVKIFIFADLTGWDSTKESIENEILNAPFDLWQIDDFNSFLCENNEILELFVYELNNELIFNVNDIL